MMPVIEPIDVGKWIRENGGLYDPPYKTNRILAQDGEFVVMMLHGPNARFDFHREAGDEFFHQIHGGIELHLKPGNGPRRVVKIREGEIFLCPGGLAHSPRRPEGSWGLVIERRRKPDEHEEFIWFCENCDERVLSRSVAPADVAAQVMKIYQSFNADAALRTCTNCGYVFPLAPVAERLSFL